MTENIFPIALGAAATILIISITPGLTYLVVRSRRGNLSSVRDTNPASLEVTPNHAPRFSFL